MTRPAPAEASPLARAQALLRERRPAEARAACEAFLQQAPGQPQALLLHGLACAELGDFKQAAASLEGSLAASPMQPPAVRLVCADVLLQAGEPARAERVAREALAQPAATPALHNVLGVALYRQGRVGEARAAYEACLAADPGHVTACRNLSELQAAAGELDAAIASRRRAIELTLAAPGAGDALALGRLLHARVRLHEALGALEEALRLDPSAVDAWLELGNTYADLAMHDRAQECYRQVLRLRPGFHEVESTLLVNLHYDPACDARAMYEAHRAWASRHATAVARVELYPRRAGSTRLRVAFMSPALRAGPTGTFLLPLLQHLDRGRFEVLAYNANGRKDAFTPQLQAATDGWYDAWSEDDEALARRIRDDGVDILVDCAGHTPGGRPLVLARKPAPLVATWLDYFDTTGLDAVDLLVGDPVSTPPDGSQLFSERIVRIDPCRLCYSPPAYAPAVRALPARARGDVTFGSFNRLSKMVPSVLASWARLLAAVPGSRLVLKNAALDDPATRESVTASFVAHGIAAARIELRGHSPHAQMLDEYGDVDIALDPFPYNGGLTTCEALWMGAPVLCRRGDSLISRQSAAIVAAAGLHEWIAQDDESFVARGRAFASDLDRLAALRSGLRARLESSPVTDGAAFARRFGDLLQAAWAERS